MKSRMLLAGAATAIVMGASVWSATVHARTDEPKRVEVVAMKFSYEPSELTLKKGEPVILVLKSADVAHGLRFRDLHVDVHVPKGGSSEVQFTPDKTGDFVGHCSVFCGSGHGSMMLKLHVVE